MCEIYNMNNNTQNCSAKIVLLILTVLCSITHEECTALWNANVGIDQTGGKIYLCIVSGWLDYRKPI